MHAPTTRRPTRTASFPRSSRSDGRASRRIVSCPYDSDSDVSFVQPYASKKCVVKASSLLDRIHNNASNIHTFGRRLALNYTNAIQTFVACEDDDDSRDSEDDDDSSQARRTRRRRKAMNMILEEAIDQAGRCGAKLSSVVPEAANPCLVPRDDDESSVEAQEPKRRYQKKIASEARPHDGSLSDGISITTDAYSTDGHCYEEDLSDDDQRSEGSMSQEESVWSHTYSSDHSSSTKSVDSNQKRRLQKLQRRRSQFLRRRAIEHNAGTETDDDETAASFHYGRPRLGGIKNRTKNGAFPSQELRMAPSLNKSKRGTGRAPDLVNTSNDDSVVIDTDDEAILNAQVLPPQKQNRNIGDSVNKNLKWQVIDRVLQHQSPPSNPGQNFLETSHIGPVVTQLPMSFDAGLQPGDVIIRLNGEDVSGSEAIVVSKMINEMTEESGRITYLRKNMEL